MLRTITVNVTAVYKRFVRVQGVLKPKWDVQTSFRAPLHGGMFETFCPFAADTCQQAERSGRSVVLRYRSNDDIDGVELFPEWPAQAEGVAS